MRDRACFIVNGALARRAWPRLEQRIRDFESDIRVAFTSGPRDAEDISRRAVQAGINTIVAVGGDGTAHEVINGCFADNELAKSRIRLGIIPFGTGNDLARSLRIPRGEAALPALLGHPRAIDVGMACFENQDKAEERRLFLNVAATGWAAEVTQSVGKAHKQLGGFLAYFAGTLGSLNKIRSQEFELTIDRGKPIVLPLVTLAVANGRYFGAGMELAPKAQLNDGLLDAITLGPINIPRLLYALGQVYTGKHLDLSEIGTVQAKEISLKADRPFCLMLDGEVMTAKTTWVKFQVLPKALLVIA